MEDPGIKDVISAIFINEFREKFRIIPKNLASGNEKMEIKYIRNPYMVTNSITGAAKIFEIQNVIENVLNIYAIIGIIIIFAANVIVKEFIIQLIGLILQILNF